VFIVEYYNYYYYNFVGADRQLCQLINSTSAQSIIMSATSHCDWKFKHLSLWGFMGGRSAISETLFSENHGRPQVYTRRLYNDNMILCRVKAVLNSLPLTPASTDPQDRDNLTPGHFFDRSTVASSPTAHVQVPGTLNNRPLEASRSLSLNFLLRPRSTYTRCKSEARGLTDNPILKSVRWSPFGIISLFPWNGDLDEYSRYCLGRMVW